MSKFGPSILPGLTLTARLVLVSPFHSLTSSMKHDYIDRLSTELITLILLELPTIQSLHSLIRASPKILHVFLASKENILLFLLRRTIKPAVFIDALAAVQASQLKESSPDRKTVLAFLRRYEIKRHKAVEEQGQHFSRRTAVSLCQLYWSTQYFIKELTIRSNFYLHRCRDSFIRSQNGSSDLLRKTGKLSIPLSFTEETRLERAFYRYQLYTQIFSSDMEYGGEKLWELPSDSHFFLNKYQHWEIEELACVENYLWSLLSNAFDRIEPAFVGIQLPAPPLDESEPVQPQTYNRSVALRAARYQIHSLYVDYLLSLSLPFIRYALRLDRLDMQRKISSHIYYDGQKRSLSTALEGLWKMITHIESNMIHNYVQNFTQGGIFLFKDTIHGPNEGWLSVYGNNQSISPYAIKNTTQSLGYVFWDCKRLRISGFLFTRYVEGSSVFGFKADILLQNGRDRSTMSNQEKAMPIHTLGL